MPVITVLGGEGEPAWADPAASRPRRTPSKPIFLMAVPVGGRTRRNSPRPRVSPTDDLWMKSIPDFLLGHYRRLTFLTAPPRPASAPQARRGPTGRCAAARPRPADRSDRAPARAAARGCRGSPPWRRHWSPPRLGPASAPWRDQSPGAPPPRRPRASAPAPG